MSRQDPYLPPGVGSHMIPGNRTEDMDEEQFEQELELLFMQKIEKEVVADGSNLKHQNELWDDLWNTHLTQQQIDLLFAWAVMARDLGYQKGQNDAKTDADIAAAERQPGRDTYETGPISG